MYVSITQYSNEWLSDSCPTGVMTAEYTSKHCRYNERFELFFVAAVVVAFCK